MPFRPFQIINSHGRVVTSVTARNSREALRIYARQAGHSCWIVQTNTRLFVEGVGDYFVR